jgi:hypothetical protein
MIVYKTTNLLNGKIYVGQDSKNNPNYLGSGVYIGNAIQKHGKKNFRKEILCECSTKVELDEKERFWIKELDCKVPNGYNISDGGEGRTGPMSEEQKKKMRNTRSEKGRKNIAEANRKPEKLEKSRKLRSTDAKKNIKNGANRPEVLERKKEYQIKRYQNPEERLKQSELMKIVANRPEVLEKNRRSRGPMSEEQKELRRKPKSEEVKRNMKLSQQKRRKREKNEH